MGGPALKQSKPTVPSYRRQKRPGACDRAFVQINGRRKYLGIYGTEESRQRYAQFVAEWGAAGGAPQIEPHADITIVEVMAAYWRHTKQYYRRADGTPTNEISNIQQALRPLKQLYGRTPAAEFGPRRLRSVRQWMTSRWS